MLHILVAMFLLGISHAVCFWGMTELKYSKRTTALIYSAYPFIFLCAVILVYTLLGNSFARFGVGYAVTIVIAFLIFVFTSADQMCKKIFLFISYANVFSICACFSIILCNVIFNGASENLAYYLRNIIRTALIILIAVVYMRFLRAYVKVLSGRHRKIWYSISTVSALFLAIFASFLVTISSTDEELIKHSLFFAAVVLMYASALWVIFGTIKFMIAENNTELVNQNIFYLQEQLKTARENELSAKTVRHDFRHHNRNIEAMLKKGEVQEALSYLKQYDDSLAEIKPNDFCANITVNAILNSFYTKAQKNGISLSVEADTAEDTAISNMDFNAILSNLLENAINGCVECQSNGNIKVNIRTVADKTVIVCSNPCRGDIVLENNMIKNQGIGISSMLLAMKKYDGDIKYSYDNEVLTACVILNS